VDAAVQRIKNSVSGGGSAGGMLSDAEIKAHFVTLLPDGAPLDQNVPLGNLPAAWANEILPVAKQAHTRLTFTTLPQPIHDRYYTFRWSATEPAGGDDYTSWA